MTSDNERALGGCGVFILFGLFCLCSGITFCCDGPVVSEGHRDGRVQKFSRKGLLRSTWEGELALPGFRRRADGLGNVWLFSVENDQAELIEQLEKLPPDQDVRIHYREHLWKSWWHDSAYRVIRVEPVRRGD